MGLAAALAAWYNSREAAITPRLLRREKYGMGVLWIF